MLEENENLKNSMKDTSSVHPQNIVKNFGLVSLSISYIKVNKLITALYIVTDIMDKNEPIRNELRTLGVNIISDTYLASKQSLITKIDHTLSLMDIASTIGMISEMNRSILKKEFTEFKQAIQSDSSTQELSLENFWKSSPDRIIEDVPKSFSLNQENSIGQNKQNSTRIGVQKGGTLLKALSGLNMSVKDNSLNFDLIRKERRELIFKIIKDKPEGASIKDIMSRLSVLGKKYGEKTLQRELSSMAHEGVLYKSGEKRWSRYSIK